MRIAVIGAGGVGGHFGGRLATAGNEVQFLARGRHLAAMRANGLRIESELGAVHLAQPDATDDPSQLRTAEVVLVTVKLWDLAQTGRDIAPGIGANTIVIPLQNGVEAGDLLRESIPRERIAGGVAYIAAAIREPGVIAITGTMAKLRYGPLMEPQRPVLEAFKLACNAAGVDADITVDIRRTLWEKFVFLNALSGRHRGGAPSGRRSAHRSGSAGDDRSLDVRDAAPGPRERRGAARGFCRRADAIPRYAPRRDALVDAE